MGKYIISSKRALDFNLRRFVSVADLHCLNLTKLLESLIIESAVNNRKCRPKRS